MGQTQEVTVTRVCDACEKTIQLIQGKITHLELEASSGWYVVSCEHLVGGDQLMPIAKLACSKDCALSLINSTALDSPVKPSTEHSNVLDFKRIN